MEIVTTVIYFEENDPQLNMIFADVRDPQGGYLYDIKRLMKPEVLLWMIENEMRFQYGISTWRALCFNSIEDVAAFRLRWL